MKKNSIKCAVIFLLLSLFFGIANARDVAKMSLSEVYALSSDEVEEIVLSSDREECDILISSVTQGEDDPAQLSPAQFCAVKNYSNARFAVNRLLWETDPSGSKLSGQDWAYVRVLDSALAKIENYPAALVYRGTSRKEVQFTKPGQIVRLKGYSSTTLNREVAEEFIGDRLMVIKPLSGKNIRIYSNVGREEEILLPRSTYVRFDRAEIKTLDLFTDAGPEKRKVEIVYLTEVPKP